MSARQMGMQAARSIVTHMAGEESELDFCFEMFAHVTKFFGHKVVLVGLYNWQKLDKQFEVLLRVTPGCEYVMTVMKDGKMQIAGALLIGETDLEETLENLILNQLDLTVSGEDQNAVKKMKQKKEIVEKKKESNIIIVIVSNQRFRCLVSKLK
jgi:NAD(P)H-nitrite reductase large subunit